MRGLFSAIGAVVVVAGAARPAGPAMAALTTGIGRPAAVAVGADGSVYVGSPEAGRIFRVTPQGTMTVIAGGGPRRPDTAPSSPVSLALDPRGNLYFADDADRTVFRIDAGDGMVTIVLGSPAGGFPRPAPVPTAPPSPVTPGGGRDAPVRPWGLAVDPGGNLYVADRATHEVIRVRPGGGPVERVAGSGVPGYVGDGGPASSARLSGPEGIALDARGHLFIADRGNHCVRRVDLRTGLITTVAGQALPGAPVDGGKAASAALRDPVAVAVDRAGNLFIADVGQARVRVVEARTGVISTPTGLGAVAAGSIALTPEGALVVADLAKGRVWRRSSTGAITTIAGDGSLGLSGDGGLAVSAYLARPAGLARDAEGRLYVADAGAHRVRRIDSGSGLISTVAGNGRRGFSGDAVPATTTSLNGPESLCFDRDGNLLIADAGNHRVRKVARDGIITTVAGSGRDGLARDGDRALEADIGRPSGIAVDGDGRLIVVQGQYGLVHRIDPDGALRTIAGSRGRVPVHEGEPSTAARIERISAFALDVGGDVLVAEEGSLRIWRIAARTGIATAVAGRGLGAPREPPDRALGVSLGAVQSLARDAAGNLYVADFPGGVRRVDGTGHVVTIAGDAHLRPAGLLFVEPDTLYVADSSGRVWRLAKDGTTVTVAGGGFGF